MATSKPSCCVWPSLATSGHDRQLGSLGTHVSDLRQPPPAQASSVVRLKHSDGPLNLEQGMPPVTVRSMPLSRPSRLATDVWPPS